MHRHSSRMGDVVTVAPHQGSSCSWCTGLQIMRACHDQLALQNTGPRHPKVFSARSAGCLLTPVFPGALALTAKSPPDPFLAPLIFMTNLVSGFFSNYVVISSITEHGTKLALRFKFLTHVAQRGKAEQSDCKYVGVHPLTLALLWLWLMLSNSISKRWC